MEDNTVDGKLFSYIVTWVRNSRKEGDVLETHIAPYTATPTNTSWAAFAIHPSEWITIPFYGTTYLGENLLYYLCVSLSIRIEVINIRFYWFQVHWALRCEKWMVKNEMKIKWRIKWVIIKNSFINLFKNILLHGLLPCDYALLLVKRSFPANT